MKEISADAKNPRLKMFRINGLFLGVRVVAALQAFVFMMGLLFAKIDGFRTLSPLPLNPPIGPCTEQEELRK